MRGGVALAHVKDVRLSLGGAPLFAGVEFTLRKGERACLVGANGAGKSTLMRIMAGLIEPDAGEIAFASGATIALVPQETDLSGAATLRDFARTPSSPRLGSHHDVPAHAAEAALQSFGLDPDRAPLNLSGGEMRRAALARAFAAEPDILLLDEPTNHLDIAAIEDLEDRIAGSRGACLIISHDRRFLERASTSTLWLRQHRIVESAEGFAAFDAWAEAIETEEARAMAKLETNLRAEEHWLRRGVTARRARNEGRRRKLQAMRAERQQRKSLAATPKAQLEAERGGDVARLVIEAKSVSKSYGDRAIVSNLSLRVMRGDRIGVVGPNGAGKSTLLELLLKKREPDTGSVRLGANLEIAYVDQARAILHPADTIWDSLAPQGGDQVMVRGRPRHVAAYARDFLFRPEQLRQPVSALSGDERNRLALAVALAKPADLIVLDEPTNDLDLDTLDALEDMLLAYEGTVILVSHDRAFLDGVATQIVGATGNGRWAETPGGWADFEREHGRYVDHRPAAERPRTDKPAPPPPRKAKKLSFKDEHRSAELDALLPKLATEIADLEALLSDAAAFARDPARFDVAAKRLAAARTEKDQAEDEWLEIETRREALQNE
ncbi:MAG TPA: ABC-F family ATP-binding cassette domain-containing protein [Caulobacterales bacterium]|nr:ABC-F family ATP-binding cassette domain-containing protein [Caulobacterales bacterium]